MSVARLVLPLLVAPALAAATMAAAPAHAVVVFQSPGTTQQFAFDGLTTIDGVQISGTGALDALVTLRLAATDGFTWRFTYQVQNQAGTGFDRARITGFGFDVARLPTSQPTATGTFNRVGTGMVGGGFDADVCLMAAGNGCGTLNNAGIRPGDPASGTFQLSYASRQTMVELSNLYVRWQGSQVDRALPARTEMPAVSVGWMETDPAPEPAAWAMMILGFGLVGAAARRRSAPARKTA